MATDPQKVIEKSFAKKLARAGWHTYRDESTGRVVTNAYRNERTKLERLSGLLCEVVTGGPTLDDCAKIGPCIPNSTAPHRTTP